MKKIKLNPKQIDRILKEAEVGNEVVYAGLSLKNHVPRVTAQKYENRQNNGLCAPFADHPFGKKARDDG